MKNKILFALLTALILAQTACAGTATGQNVTVSSGTVSDSIAGNDEIQPTIMDYSGFVKIDRTDVGGVRVLKNTVMRSGDDFVAYEDGEGTIAIGDALINVKADSCVKIISENDTYIIKLIDGDMEFEYMSQADAETKDNVAVKESVSDNISHASCIIKTQNTEIDSITGQIEIRYIPHYQNTIVNVTGGSADILYADESQTITNACEFAGNAMDDKDFWKNDSTPVYLATVDLYVNDTNHYIDDFSLQEGYCMSAKLDDSGMTDTIDIYQDEQLLCTIESPVTFAVGYSGDVVYHEETDDYLILVYEKILEKMDKELTKVPTGKFTYSCFVKVDNPPYDPALDTFDNETGALTLKSKKAKQENHQGFYIRLANYEGTRPEIISRYLNVIENVLPEVKSLHMTEIH